jgi:hypothetical protein
MPLMETLGVELKMGEEFQWRGKECNFPWKGRYKSPLKRRGEKGKKQLKSQPPTPCSAPNGTESKRSKLRE